MPKAQGLVAGWYSSRGGRHREYGAVLRRTAVAVLWPRPLVEDNSVRSKSTAVFNGRDGYKISPSLSVQLESFNLTNRKVSSIDYYYTSRLPGELGEGIDDFHFHPIESRSFRLSMAANS